ncbi:hypothetical protein [Corallococcus sicarius]|uniref:hypothetical protein n=1 Tax=Corallococcus sicarius TaxID=2316726 RepID=UPI0013153F0B|nr:hypothetical protein [Corallococcus sicarius]
MGSNHSLSIAPNGSVWTWGCNYLGQLGDGSTAHSFLPKVVPGVSGIVAVSAGTYHSLAVGQDGSFSGWGYSSVGPPAGEGFGPGQTPPAHGPAL